MPNEPILITSSEEGNSIKMWYFEKGITVPRLLRQRSGHSDAPIKMMATNQAEGTKKQP